MNARQKAAESVKNNGILPGSIKLPVDFEDIPFSSSGVSESDEIRLMLKNRVECNPTLASTAKDETQL